MLEWPLTWISAPKTWQRKASLSYDQKYKYVARVVSNAIATKKVHLLSSAKTHIHLLCITCLKKANMNQEKNVRYNMYSLVVILQFQELNQALISL